MRCGKQSTAYEAIAPSVPPSPLSACTHTHSQSLSYNLSSELAAFWGLISFLNDSSGNDPTCQSCWCQPPDAISGIEEEEDTGRAREGCAGRMRTGVWKRPPQPLPFPNSKDRQVVINNLWANFAVQSFNVNDWISVGVEGHE